MKPLPDETYESWCKRVEMYEHGNAMMQVAQGKDIEKVMEDMSRRIMDKLLHPIYKAIRESNNTSVYNSEESRQSYFDKMGNRGAVADHVSNDTLDNSIE
jgi:glutamyl-tRNA reductase